MTRKFQYDDPDQVIQILNAYVRPFSHTVSGRLPSDDILLRHLERGIGFTEHTIDALGARDWKLDQSADGSLSVRYRGDRVDAREASLLATQLLGAVIVDRVQ